jgi:hypothetical protein
MVAPVMSKRYFPEQANFSNLSYLILGTEEKAQQLVCTSMYSKQKQNMQKQNKTKQNKNLHSTINIYAKVKNLTFVI